MRFLLSVFLVSTAAFTARADVIFEEPTQITCGRSEVIVAGTVTGTTTSGPFTNAQPPSVKITAATCWKGCKVGDKIEVAEWVEPKPSHSGKPHPADPQAEEEAWRKAEARPPAAGTKVMLFLRRDGERLFRVQDSGGYGSYVMLVDPSEKQTQRSAGMCEIAVGISGDRDRSTAIGKPVTVHVEVTNTSGKKATFHAESMTLKLQTDTRPGEDLAPQWTPMQSLTLDPGTQLGFDWDLTKLFPDAFLKPGNYWLTLDAPAALGLHWISISVK
ncbi:MAG TPA: hypothetical protein VMT89_02670 [Candidatus Acidoferrales bacterium]|nr:hypothetical protein [Candidatus Acidoferrales bacterium]